ncbi:hypothetical protein TNCT_701301 [Trichonephila clavata]|uniref:Uncharacterized protein n=1 Tax=Trichonephila clavata TaxID=2740835 RepID=A0A8X6G9H3_TRICU|nr:hypothetical protein TNCT_701301 [Trichonephila clavata]
MLVQLTRRGFRVCTLHRLSVVEALKQADAPQLLQFCDWLLTEIKMNGLDICLFLFLMKRGFSYGNSQNDRFWAVENQHITSITHHCGIRSLVFGVQ